MRRVQVNQNGLKLNDTHQFWFMLMKSRILVARAHTVQKNTETIVVASKEIGLKVNADKTKTAVMSRNQNAVRIYNIKIDDSSFERVESNIWEQP